MSYSNIADIIRAEWDYVIVNISGGKDSTALIEWARFNFPNATILLVHAEIDIDWAATLPTVHAQAEYYDLPLTVVRAIKADGKPSGFIRQLLSPRQVKVKHPPEREDFEDDAEHRKAMDAFLKKETPENRIARSVGETHYTAEYSFPDMGNRWCTSMLKTGPIQKFIRTLKGNILNLIGERAEESAQRAKLEMIRPDAKLSKNGRNVVTVSPILNMLEDAVWDIVHKSGAPIHPCYSWGVSRASCAICIFSNNKDIRVAWDHEPEMVLNYIDSEAKIAHSFKYKPATKSRGAVRVSVLDLLLSTFDEEDIPQALLSRMPSAQLV